MAMRDDLRKWVDELPDTDLPVVWRMFKGLRHSVEVVGEGASEWVPNAPIDDEALSRADRASLERADADLAAGRVTLVPAEEMRRRILG